MSPRFNFSLPSKPYVLYCGQEVCRESISALIAIINKLRNELSAVKAASRHRFTASEVKACLQIDEHEDGSQSIDYEATAKALNDIMQNIEDYKEPL